MRNRFSTTGLLTESGSGGMIMFKEYIRARIDERSYSVFVAPLQVVEGKSSLILKFVDSFAKELFLNKYGGAIRDYLRKTGKEIKIIVEKGKPSGGKWKGGIGLKKYREEIRKMWLPVMGRKKLKGYEYTIISDFYNEKIPLKSVLIGLKRCLKEAKKRGKVVYSMGYCLPYIKGRGKNG